MLKSSIPSCSVFVISSSFFCFNVSTTSARLPLRRSGVPKAELLSRSPRSLAPSSGLCGEVELFRKEYKEHTLLLSDSCRRTQRSLNRVTFFFTFYSLCQKRYQTVRLSEYEKESNLITFKNEKEF